MNGKKFNVGDRLTYKYTKDLVKRNYCYGGDCYGNKKGIITKYLKFIEECDCYKIQVSIPGNIRTYNMLESEFLEFDNNKENYEIY